MSPISIIVRVSRKRPRLVLVRATFANEVASAIRGRLQWAPIDCREGTHAIRVVAHGLERMTRLRVQRP